MIVSDKYRYLFLETPHTGSTAVSKELVECYGGREILHKHANYCEFARAYPASAENYFVFAGVRNPLDEAASLFNKFRSNHKNNYSDVSKQKQQGGWVSKKNIEIFRLVQTKGDFGKYMRDLYRKVYNNNINVNKKYCDSVMRFEHLDTEFANVLERIGVEKHRSLPVVNRTSKAGSFEEYYSDSDIELCVRVFGAFMAEWDYAFPGSWEAGQPNFINKLTYNLAKIARSMYAEYLGRKG